MVQKYNKKSIFTKKNADDTDNADFSQIKIRVNPEGLDEVNQRHQRYPCSKK